MSATKSSTHVGFRDKATTLARRIYPQTNLRLGSDMVLSVVLWIAMQGLRFHPLRRDPALRLKTGKINLIMPFVKRILLSCAIILLAAIVVSLGSIAASAGALILSNQVRVMRATPTATPFPITSLPPADNNNLPVGITARMDEIQQQIIQLRGFEPSKPLDRELLTPGELRQNVMTDFLADYSLEEARDDSAILTVFGLLEPGFDLMAFYKELYSEQIAGYYDDELEEMFVVKGSGFGGQESSTYAHEYVHVLQDQTFDISEGLKFNPDDCKKDSERCLGVQALIEGDASVTEQAWVSTYASEQDRQEISDFYSAFSSPVYDSAPAFMQQDFLFPYRYGAEFIYSLRDQGGWDAVNAAYLNPPVSAEQILHPERYPEDKPLLVEMADLSNVLNPPWLEIDRGVMGEWYLYLILANGYLPEIRQPDTNARAAATGWGGDAYAVYQKGAGGPTLYTQKIVFETETDAVEFQETAAAYGDSRWGIAEVSNSSRKDWVTDTEAAILLREGSSIYWIVSPDSEIANSILAELTRQP